MAARVGPNLSGEIAAGPTRAAIEGPVEDTEDDVTAPTAVEGATTKATQRSPASPPLNAPPFMVLTLSAHRVHGVCAVAGLAHALPRTALTICFIGRSVSQLPWLESRATETPSGAKCHIEASKPRSPPR